MHFQIFDLVLTAVNSVDSSPTIVISSLRPSSLLTCPNQPRATLHHDSRLRQGQARPPTNHTPRLRIPLEIPNQVADPFVNPCLSRNGDLTWAGALRLALASHLLDEPE
jgi:hypothetical protein